MTPLEQYQANLALVRRKAGALADDVDRIIFTNFQFLPAQTGATMGAFFEPSLQGWVPGGAMDDPWAEAERDAAALYVPQARVFILLGLGLGYFAVALAKRLKPYQKLGIFEIDPIVFKAAMHCVDLSSLLEEGRVATHLGESMEAAIEQFCLSLETGEKFGIAPPLRAGVTAFHHKERYEALQGKTMDLLRYHGVGLATWQQFGRHIGNNDAENLYEYLTLPGLNALDKAWEGRPAICIAAGPSLVKNLRTLTEAPGRAGYGLLTVGTCYALVRALGLTPDVVSTIDFQRLNWTDQFAGVPLDPRAALVYLHSTYPDTPRRWPGPTFVARNASDFTQWMSQYGEPKAHAAQVQTVAHLNLVTAYALGANPILLVGQDLSQPQERHHAPGARAQDCLVGEAPDSHLETLDQYGQKTWTRHSYLSMRTVFSQLIAQHPEVQVWNCTEGGLPIAGARHLPLAQALAELGLNRPAPRAVSLARICAERAQAYGPQANWEGLRAGLQQLRTEADALAAHARRFLDLSPPLGGEPVPTPQQIAGWMPEAQRHALVEAGAFWQTLPPGFALYTVRRFELVAMLSVIVPDEDTWPEADREALRVLRTWHLSHAVAEEWPAIERLLTRVEARLTLGRVDAPVVDEAACRVLFRRQLYRDLAQALDRPETLVRLGPAGLARWKGLVAYARGLYAEAITWWGSTPATARFVSSAYHRLDRHQRGMLAALGPYLAHGGLAVATPVALNGGATASSPAVRPGEGERHGTVLHDDGDPQGGEHPEPRLADVRGG